MLLRKCSDRAATMAASIACTSSLVAGRYVCKPLPAGSRPALAPQQRAHRRITTKAGLTDTGYVLADAVSKVADKADKAVGSVDAPAWVLPVS